jgi:hypothetical protein
MQAGGARCRLLGVCAVRAILKAAVHMCVRSEAQVCSTAGLAGAGTPWQRAMMRRQDGGWMDETGRAALSWEYHGTRYWSTLGCPTSSVQVSAKTTTGAVGFQKLWRS